jgi:two-component system, NarL family, nitrate/nitrite response regulator NarL
MRILLAGDHALLLEGLSKLLTDEAGAEVRTMRLGHDLDTALAGAQPQVVILEAAELEPVADFAARLRIANPHLPLLVIAPNDRRQFLGALRAGARGFIGRHVSVDELLGAVRAVERGEWGIPRALVAELVADYLRLVEEREAHAAIALSERQRRILALLAGGANAAHIAERLMLAASTVRAEIRAIVRQLGVANRAQAVAEVLRRGLVVPEAP